MTRLMPSGCVLPDRRSPAGVGRAGAVVDRVLVVVAGGAAVLPEALVLDGRVVRAVDLVALTGVDVAVQAVVHGLGVRRTRTRQHRSCDEGDAGRSHREATTGLGLELREHCCTRPFISVTIVTCGWGLLALKPQGELMYSIGFN